MDNSRREDHQENAGDRPVAERGICDVTRVPQSDARPDLRRVEFTPEDDMELAQWVALAEAQGLIAGHTNPRHTESSWLKRWRSKVQPRTLLHSPPDPPPVQLIEAHSQNLASSSTGVVPDPTGHDFDRDAGDYDTEGSNAISLITPLPPLQPSQEDDSTEEEVDRSTRNKQANTSEVTLRLELGVEGEREMLVWITQDWMVRVYHKYATVMLDPYHSLTHDFRHLWNQRPSTKYYLVEAASNALSSGSFRHLRPTSFDGWTRDDADIAFIAQMVWEATRPGRSWDGRTNVQLLCAIAYRLMRWFHHIHRESTDHNIRPKNKKTRSIQWVQSLQRARLELSEASRTLSPVARRPDSPELDMFMGSGMLVQPDMHTRVDLPDMPRSNVEPDTIARGDSHIESIWHDETLVMTDGGPDHLGDPNFDNLTPKLNMLDGETREPACTHALEPDVSLSQCTPPRMETLYEGVLPGARLFKTPNYPVKVSNADPDQIQGLEWMSSAGRNRFIVQRSALLARWGVAASHTESCVLIPQDWELAAPTYELMPKSPQECPANKSTRLRFSMGDHHTSWARASTWFTDHIWPHSGVEFDNFLGHGPFAPMEGSHLCHNGHCVVSKHLVYESSGTNAGRKECFFDAQDMRLRAAIEGGQVPEHCSKGHDPPCLLRLAALTTYERYVRQFWMLGLAKGLEVPFKTPPRPSDHPYPTLDVQSKLSFGGDDADLSHLVPPHSHQPAVNLQAPTYRCIFCTSMKAFKSVVGYWEHIRNKHESVAISQRLQEIKNAGKPWKEYMLLRRRVNGDGIATINPTWAKLQQIEQADFDWAQVTMWKLRDAVE